MTARRGRPARSLPARQGHGVVARSSSVHPHCRSGQHADCTDDASGMSPHRGRAGPVPLAKGFATSMIGPHADGRHLDQTPHRGTAGAFLHDDAASLR